MRRNILGLTTAIAASALALAACGSSGSSNPGGGGGTSNTTSTTDSTTTSASTPATTSSSTASTATIASKFTFGGPPEFATRHAAQLASLYGVTFAKITPLDTGGPETVTALKNGQVDAADIFTTDPAIKADNFVVLTDPKSLFGTQNVVPLIAKSKATAGVKQVLNFVDSKITSSVLVELRTKVETDKQDPDAVAKAFLQTLAASQPPATLNKGVSIKVGSANFQENVILADIYIEALKATGATVSSQLNIGAREKYIPALLDGSIDLVPEYAGSVLTYYDKNATASTPADVVKALGAKLPSKLEILDLSPAQDNDGIVVTKATATKYNLTSIADLAKPAS